MTEPKYAEFNGDDWIEIDGERFRPDDPRIQERLRSRQRRVEVRLRDRIVPVCFPEWRDIETAPRDGTEILAYGVCVGENFGRSKGPWITTVRWSGDNTLDRGFDWTVSCTDTYGVWMKPRGWMPLPDIPED